MNYKMYYFSEITNLVALEQKLERALDDVHQHIFSQDSSVDEDALNMWVNRYKTQIAMVELSLARLRVKLSSENHTFCKLCLKPSFVQMSNIHFNSKCKHEMAGENYWRTILSSYELP